MRDIPGYEKQYAVTEDGQVWSHKRNKFLTPLPDKDGYLRVHLCNEGKIKTFFIHRLVALTYIPNPEGKPTVNHKDEIKTNNHVSNLEWATVKENTNYGTRTQRANETKVLRNCVNARKPVYCVELDKTFPSSNAAAKELDLDQGTISKCCNGKRKSTGGYHWRFAE